MSQLHVNIVRIVLLAALASALGVVLLAIDRDRREAPSSSIARAANVQTAPATRNGAEQRRTEAVAALVAGTDTTAPATEVTQPVAVTPAKRGGVPCAQPHQLIDVPRDLPVRATPSGRAIGTLPSSSHYMGTSMRAWVQTTTPDGAWGKVTLPWTGQVSRTGWIPMTGLKQATTPILVVGDLSDRTLRVYRGCRLQLEAKSAIGASGSPSPTGRFWVTDRIAVPSSQPYFGSYAFGLSTIQPNTPAGWTGGNQMAIHGTNAPGTIGTAASAGCLRVSEGTLDRLRAMVGLGTPVVITR